MDSEAVECASEELSETMYDPFAVVRLVYKRKGHSLLYMQPVIHCTVYDVFYY